MKPTKILRSILANYVQPYVYIYIIAALYSAMHIYSIVVMNYTPFHPSFIVTGARIVTITLSVYSFYLLLFALMGRRWLSVLTGVLATLYFLLNVTYFRVFESYITVSQVVLVKQILSVKHEAMSATHAGDIFILACFALSLPLMFRAAPGRWRISLRHALMLVLIFICLWEVRFLTHTSKHIFDSIRRDKNLIYVFKTLTARSGRHLTSLKYGMLYTHAHDLYILSAMNSSKETLNGFARYVSSAPALKGNEKLPNIIIVQVESLDMSILGRKSNGKEVTPFFNRLTRESHYFDNMVAIHLYAGGTSDADFAVLTATHPLVTYPSFYARGVENIPSLPAILRHHGYETAAFHANHGGFWGRAASYPNLGFDRFYSLKYYDGLPATLRGHVPDYPFLEKTAEFMKAMKEPFFAYAITISAHSPYDPLEHAYVIPDEMDQEITAGTVIEQNYLRTINYTDRAVENFVRIVADTYDDYIILITGDHTPLIDKYQPAPEMVPTFIISNRLPKEGKHYNHLGSHLDIPPTLLAFTPIPPSSLWAGQDLISSDRDSICLLNPLIRVHKNGDNYPDESCMTDEAAIAERYLRF